MRINGYVPNEEVFKISFNQEKVNETKESNGLFSTTLKKSLDDINEKQIIADEAAQAFVKGDSDMDISEVMLLGEEAKISLQYAVQIRNKLVDAYQEITKMQL